MSIRDFGKMQHLPGNLEGHTCTMGCGHAQGSACAQEGSEEALSSHLWPTLRLCASKKWRLRCSCQLPGWMLKLCCSNMHTEPLDETWEKPEASKEISIQPLADHTSQQRLGWSTQQKIWPLWNYFRTVIKQITTNNNHEPWGRGKSDF